MSKKPYNAKDPTFLMNRLKTFAWPLFLVLSLAIVYGMTLLPDVGGWGDTGKFQFLGHVLGTPHATGYPGYLLLNFLFTTFIPFGTLAFKANLFSAVCAIGACCFLYRTLKLLECSEGVAALTALAFGFTNTLWSYALVAEVYTLNIFFVSMVVFCLLHWRKTKNNRSLLLACLLYALSFGNHLTMICLLPALVSFIVFVDRKAAFTRSNILWVIAFVTLGASQYLYLYWRYLDPNALFLEMQISDWSTFWWYITGAQFKSQFFPFSFSELIFQQIPYAAQELFHQWSFFLVLALVGMWKSRHRMFASFLVTAFLGYGILVINYDIFDIASYYLPMTFVLAIFIAKGSSFLLKKYVHQSSPWPMVVYAFIPLTLMAANYGFVDQSQASKGEETREILQLIGHDAVILPAHYSQATHLWYYLLGEGLGEEKNLSIAFQDPMVPLMEEVVDYVKTDQPLYLPFERREVQPGLAVFVVGRATANELKAEGLDLKLVDLRNDLYQVQKERL